MGYNPESLLCRHCILCGAPYFVEDIDSPEKGFCDECIAGKGEDDDDAA